MVLWPEKSELALCAAIFIATSVAAVATVLFSIRKKPKKGRTMSFNSWCTLGPGAFAPESKAALPIINCILYFDKCPETSKVLEAASILSTSFDRFSSRVIEYSKKEYRWEKIVIDPGKHVIFKEANNDVHLKEMLEEIKNQDLSNGMDAPLWEYIILSNQTKEEQSAVILRVHHAIGDGISLSGIIPLVFTDENGQHTQLKDYSKSSNSKTKTKYGVGDYLVAIWRCITAAGSRFDADTPFCRHPKQCKALSMGKRKILFFPPLALSELKQLKDEAKCTLNDVLMSVWAGAIRRYNIWASTQSAQLPKIHEQDEIQFRALLPVAFPRKLSEFADAADSMRNYWTFVQMPMEVNAKNAVERLRLTQRNTQQLKNSPQAGVNLKVLAVTGPLLPRAATQQAGTDLFSRHSIIFSNVPGPEAALWFAGEKMASMQVVYANIIPQLIAVSYNGYIYQNIVLDENQEAPEKIVEFFLLELGALNEELHLYKK